MSELKPVRRIVTGHDDKGVATVFFDEPAGNRRVSTGGTVSTLIWSTVETPASIAMGENIEDGGARVLGTAPPPMGSRFSVVDLPPGSTGAFHRTDTIDYAIVIAGEVEMKLDASSVVARAGDVLVQRGTNHNWINHGSATARLAFVLIDAQPLPIQGSLKGVATAQ